MTGKISRRRFAGGVAGAAALARTALAFEWKGTRQWIGPEFWPNPLPAWRVEDGVVVALAGQNRTLHSLTNQGAADLEMRVEVMAPKDAASWAGFRFGARGKLDDYRHALILSDQWIDAAIGGDGRLRLDGKVGEERVALDGWVELALTVRGGTVELTAGNARVSASLPAGRSRGNLALLAGAAEAQTSDQWRFRNWRVSGVETHPGQTFGPILWSQYTLSRGVLKLSAQFPPLGAGDSKTAVLEVRSGAGWKKIGDSPIEALSRTAAFRVEKWKASRDTAYRVVYRWQGKDYEWAGTIRREPKTPLRVAVMSCDNGYAFPMPTLVKNVAARNPGLLYFAGDQIYEGYGGFGFAREPESLAMLDYLRKYFQFGWTWRELLRDRPSVVIPDDHDVFQGNIWGQGGRKIPKGREAGFTYGGYVQTADWVNAVQRTQCAHLPDPVDPAPVEQGIEVYFTDLLYGGVQFAILEDRKFKTGPESVFGKERPQDLKALDAEGAELLGKRQEEFLRRWSRSKDAPLKAVLSQTILCKVTTHSGPELRPSRIDLDCGGWPQSGRRRALQACREAQPVMMHGDQHVGALVRHGIDDWEDGPLAFMVPGTANGFPRAWWPDGSETGRHLDGFGHRMTVMGVANPDKGSNTIPRASIHPEELAHRKGSGFGIVTFDAKARVVTFAMWRYKDGQFPGFPQTVRLKQGTGSIVE